MKLQCQEIQVAKLDSDANEIAVVATVEQVCAVMGKTDCLSRVEDKQKNPTPQRVGQSGAVSSMVT